MSKKDPAYDQIDIDNGGGGICTLFVPAIAEKLYCAGRHMQANDLLRRTLWWAERMPYFGDFFAANAVEYRQDTPLQCTIGAAACAQAIIFGLCGIKAEFDGTVVICPETERPAQEISLEGVKLCGKQFDLQFGENEFVVRSGEKVFTAQYGTKVVLK